MNTQTLNMTDLEGRTPVYIAALRGHTAVIEILLKARADLNLAESHGATALYLACQNGHIDIVEILLQAGAQLKINTYTSGFFKSCLDPRQIAAANGHDDIVQLLDKHVSYSITTKMLVNIKSL